MTLWSGTIGMAIGFVILAAVVLWMLIDSRGKTRNTLAKAIIIPVTIWYGAAMFFSAQNLMGWPTATTVPDNVLLLASRVREPNAETGDSGAIFIWASRLKNDDGSGGFNPLAPFDYEDASDPRAYKLPYSRELHETLMKAQKGQRQQPGSMMQLQKNTGQGQPRPGGYDQSHSTMRIRIINPVDLLPKKSVAE